MQILQGTGALISGPVDAYREWRSGLDLFCPSEFNASGGARYVFGGIPFSAKWSNEELCTFCRKTTSFSSSQWIFFFFFVPVSDHLKHTVFLDNKAKWKSRTLSKGEIAAMIEWLRHYRRGHDGPYQSALFFYNRIISPPITPLIRCYRNCNNWKGIHGKREKINS